MFIADLLAAIFLGVGLVFLLSMFFGTKGPWGSLLWFFIVVSLFAWVGGVWLRPYGPIYWGVGWVPIVVIGCAIAILLTAVSPRNPDHRFASTKHLKADIEARNASVDVFFWFLVIFLVMLAMSHYFWFPQVN